MSVTAAHWALSPDDPAYAAFRASRPLISDVGSDSRTEQAAVLSHGQWVRLRQLTEGGHSYCVVSTDAPCSTSGPVTTCGETTSGTREMTLDGFNLPDGYRIAQTYTGNYVGDSSLEIVLRLSNGHPAEDQYYLIAMFEGAALATGHEPARRAVNQSSPSATSTPTAPSAPPATPETESPSPDVESPPALDAEPKRHGYEYSQDYIEGV